MPSLPVTLFTELRVLQTPDGRWRPHDGIDVESPLQAYASGLAPFRIAARSQPVEKKNFHSDHMLPLVPLPYYVGPRDAAIKLFRTFVAIWQATKGSIAICRLPGAVGLIAALSCIARRELYTVELVGDVEEVLRAESLGLVAAKLAPAVRRAMRFIVRNAAGVRYVTNGTLQKKYPSRPDSFQLAYSDVVLDDTDFASKARVRIPALPYKLISVGTLEQMYKGHDVTIRALAKLNQNDTVAVLTIVGDGRCRPHLEDLARQVGVIDQVTFTGWISDRDRLKNLLDTADLFVMASRTEGLPRALVEAMARGLPSIGSRRGGTVELLDSACLVPADDASALARAILGLCVPSRYSAASRRNLQEAARFRSALLDEKRDEWIGFIQALRNDRGRAG